MARMALVVAASLGLTLVFYILLSRIPTLSLAITTATARVTGLALTALGIEVSVQGPLLEAPGFSFEIVPDCTPLAPIMLLAGAILAFPATWRAKLNGIILGALVLGALNLIRTVSLVYIGLHTPQWLEIAHLVVWQSAMIMSGILVWLFWLKSCTRGLHA